MCFCVQRKCEVYWPEKVGDTFNAGAGINVLYKELIPFADYEIKVFSVTHVSYQHIIAACTSGHMVSLLLTAQ